MWSDRETDYDLLGFESYVQVLSEVALHPAIAPLTLGIFGSWGSGKTSLMRMLKQRLDPPEGAKEGKIKTLWFNAWRYEGREEAQAALIHAILAKVVEGKTFEDDVKGTLRRLKDGASVLKLSKFIGKTLLTMTPDIGGFIDCFRDESEKVADTMERFEGDFQKLLGDLKVEHVIVFIDDLDRCSSAKVIETFETIKLFLNVPACTFVIGADARKIEQAVGEVYSVEDERQRRDYLEKIVQLPFNIPEQALPDLTCYVGMLIVGQAFDGGSWRKLCDARTQFYQSSNDVGKAIASWVEQNRALYDADVSDILAELSDVLRHVHILARGLRGNPRQVKRFLNILSLRRKLGKINKLQIDTGMLIKLSVLEYAFPAFLTDLSLSVDPDKGTSELADAVVNADHATDEGDPSELVKRALSEPGLLEYLRATPRISNATDLRPYFVLAQTALNRGAGQETQPADDVVKGLVAAIETDDTHRTRPAARRAAAADSGVAAAVLRRLVNDLPDVKNPRILVNMISALEAVCSKHRELYPSATSAIGSLDPKGAEYISVAVGTLFASAERNGYSPAKELVEKFTAKSSLAGALTTPIAKSTRRPGTRGA